MTLDRLSKKFRVIASVALLIPIIIGARIFFMQYMDRYHPDWQMKIEKTQNVQASWFKSFLVRDTVWQETKKDSMRVRFRQYCRQTLQGDSTTIYTVKVGEQFCNRPDHHGSSYMVLQSVQNGKAIIKYNSYFNHSSFGKRLITIDEGQFDWP